MSTRAMRTTIVAVTLVATACLSPAALATEADDDCAWQDFSNSMRCFDCMKRVWTGTGWRIVNTCPNYELRR
ncbi:hypothetical protein MCBRY_002404 [Methylocystis bryophila]|uniref:Uncharacterized protein n=1 Tax=Methylocystis bryophila TaxID=655015 RepID=A0A1W6MWG6_9HYPH|nr:hypothetical protein B1812_13570 [Methylocystis bryophila]